MDVKVVGISPVIDLGGPGLRAEIPGMFLEEALEIAEMTVVAELPPTNPIALSRALVVLFRENKKEQAGWILDWLDEIGFRRNRFTELMNRDRKVGDEI